MLGAMIGDIVGSPYESRSFKTDDRDFPLFSRRSHMTDDSILSMAVMDGAVRGLGDEETSRVEIAKSIKLYARTHRHRGYGGRFCEWIDSDLLEGYDSFGNGAAMRVSSIAYLYGTLESVERFAAISAMPTRTAPYQEA